MVPGGLRLTASLLLAALCVAAAPSASAALVATLAAPEAPVPLDGSSSVTLTLTLDCSHFALRPSSSGVQAAIVWAESPVAMLGPETITIGPSPCLTDPMGSATGEAAFNFTGSSLLPGLVAIPLEATATLDSSAADSLDALDPAGATASVVPVPLVSIAFERVLVPPVPGRTIDISAVVSSTSNVPVVVTFQATGRPSEEGRDLVFRKLVLPRGQLEVPGPVAIAAANETQTPTGSGVFPFTAVDGFAGTDNFQLLATASVDGYPDATASAEALLSLPYDTRSNETDDKAADRVGGEITPNGEVPGPLAPVVAALLMAGAAVRRRR